MFSCEAVTTVFIKIFSPEKLSLNRMEFFDVNCTKMRRILATLGVHNMNQFSSAVAKVSFLNDVTVKIFSLSAEHGSTGLINTACKAQE